jgi:hypothetical protein
VDDLHPGSEHQVLALGLPLPQGLAALARLHVAQRQQHHREGVRLMRLEPEDEMLLMAERAILRFCCNWLWPLNLLGNVLWTLMHADEQEWWGWVWMVVWLFACFYFWKKDVAKLRAVRAKIEEAHR